MSTSFKFRLLLALLTLSFVATAISLNLTFHKENILDKDARTLERNLHKKEQFAETFINNPFNFKELQQVEQNEQLASQLITRFKENNNIYLNTYQNNKLVFWTANLFTPETDAGLKDGFNLLRTDNGYYEAIKRSSGEFSVVCIIPVKTLYPFQNRYLNNHFSRDLIKSDNLEIASSFDKLSYNIRNSKGNYLFSVKLKSEVSRTFYSRLELWMWIGALFSICVLINYICAEIAEKGRIKLALGLLLVVLLVIRILMVQFPLFHSHFDIPIFEHIFSYGDGLFPSVGDFLLNLLAATFFLSFAYNYKDKITFGKQLNKNASLSIFILLGAIFSLIALQVNNLFYELITHSNINFDLGNILSLSGLSWFGILLLCIAVLNLYLLLETILSVSTNLNLTNKDRFSTLLTATGLFLIFKLFFQDFSLSFLILSVVVFVRSWTFYYNVNKYNLAVFVFTLLSFSIISSLKLSGFQVSKEREQRKIYAQKLESSDDPNAALLFLKLEEDIVNDVFLVNYISKSIKDEDLLHERLKRFYFDGYLSKYQFKTFIFKDGKSVNDSAASLNHFKELVISGSIKVSHYFYRVNNTFGFHNYFGLLPIRSGNEIIGTLIIELRSKTFKESSFPRILVNGEMDRNEALSDYSFAFYNNNKLLNQYGDYVYDLDNNDFHGKTGSFIFVQKNDYTHLIFKPNPSKLIVVSKHVPNGLAQIASFSFLFLVFLIFFVFVVFIHWLTINFSNHDFRVHLFNWNYLLARNQILYRTRIQASMVSAIITTLFIVGGITYFSILNQYRKEQEANVFERINSITEGFENKMFYNGTLSFNNQSLSTFADINAVDLNLYNLNGKMIFTTQPKIYEYGLKSSRMNSLAYVYLSKYQRSEYIKREQIGEMPYITAYKPIRDTHNETIAYLSLPYYNYTHEIEKQISSFLNTLINVYALVLVTIGFFAVFVANQITYPLTLVQKSLSEIKIGSKNEPIIWKRNDEIGSLIREYNNMIRALEENAQKLARSERESAWREMAKQVAHEIKNPLTPLKLGVQLLEKSWKEKDPNFDKKFEKFSKSFIEQIESLSHISSEFSNFAKMPDTSFSNVNLQDVIEQSIEVYSKLNELKINFTNFAGSETIIKGDRDQLLRIFNNLIKNAVEAIPDYVEGYIEIVLAKKDNFALIEVKDNGRGIPEGLKERIFHPNFTTKSSGTGLGLAFVKQAIENMMGKIEFKTEDNKGTTFYIRIPLTA
ncbi:ATP-binding protein [Rubrolithibacter danxiaensis]|uniref:sensor histidine kinase n=1 Tax=Rubrolithibacter danxiaensis TaxID=3390805 RepID=UPI003BF8850B